MKKVLFIIGFIVIAAVGVLAALVVITFNPEVYRKQAMASVRELTGRDLTVGGQTVMTWMPMPTIVMEKVQLSNQGQSTEKTMLTAESVRVQVEWSSLLKSPLVVKSIELRKPALLLERLKSNRANFAFPFLLDPDRQLAEADFLTGASTTTKIDRVSISDGMVRYVNHITGQDMTVTDVNGDLAVDSLRGPFRFQGSGVIDGHEMTAQVTTGIFKTAIPVDVGVKINEAKSKTVLDVSGQLTPDATDKWFSGVGTFSVQTPNTLLGVLGWPGVSDALNKPTVGNMTVEVTPTTDALKDFTVRFGEGETAAALTGSVIRSGAGAQPSWQVQVGMNVFNPEDWREYWQLAGWDDLGADKKYPDVSFQVNMQTVPYLKDAVQNVAVQGRYQAGRLRIEKASALMPGRTAVALSGMAESKGGKPSWDMRVSASADSAKTWLSWLFPDNAWVRETKMLQQAKLEGRVVVEPKQVLVSAQEFKVDATTMTGTVRRTAGEKTAYDVQVSLANWDADAYTGWQKAEKPVEMAQLPWILRSAVENAGPAADATVRVTADMRDGMIFGLPVSSVRFVGGLDQNVLKIDTLTMQNLAMANVDVSGQIIGVGRPQPRVSQLSLKLNTKQLSGLLERAGVTAGWPLITSAGETEMALMANGGNDGIWRVSAMGHLGEANIRLQGDLVSPETTLGVKDLSVDLAHPSFRQAMALIWPEQEILPKLAGAFKAKGMINGGGTHWEVKDGLVGVGTQRITGGFVYDGKGGRRTVRAELQSPSLDIGKFVSDDAAWYAPASGFATAPFDFGFLNEWEGQLALSANQILFRDWDVRNAEVEVEAKDKKISLKRFEGSAEAGQSTPVQMKGDVDWSGTPVMNAEVLVQNMPLRPDFMVLENWALGSGQLSLRAAVKAQGKSPAEMSRGLSGQGEVMIRGAQMMGVNIEQMVPIVTRAMQRGEEPSVFEPQMKRVLSSGKTPVTSLQGAFGITDGVIRMMDLTMKMPNAEANPTQVIWDLPKQTMDISIPVQLTPLSHLPPFVLGISVNRGKSVYRPSVADLSQAMVQQMKHEQAEEVAEQQQQAQQAAIQTRTERLEEAARLTETARVMVNNMEIQIRTYPNDKADRILQAARDALAIVNQIAIREEPTDAQLIQQIEQARLVMVKNDEFTAVMSRETLMSTQATMDDYVQKGRAQVRQMQAWATDRSEIIMLERLAQNAAQNLAVIEKAATLLEDERSAAEVTQIMTTAETALARITAAYERAAQFDMAAEEAVSEGTSEEAVPLAGAIGRAN